MRKYTTGKFAKMANVTPRTIRYYDKCGLLKPNLIGENGYRYYVDADLLKLQRILLLKQLGFSLEEIAPILIENDFESFQKSLNVQLELVDKKIEHLTSLRNTLKNTTKFIENNTINWDYVLELIQLINNDKTIIEQYHNSTNLNARIELHDHYSTNEIKWFPWVFQHIDFRHVNRLLELGCGNGEIWNQLTFDLRNRDIYLTDISKGMVEDTKKNLDNSNFSYLTVDCNQIPFKDHFFDAVMANHMLFYLKDIDNGLNEITRVLNNEGDFYCTTYSAKHMKELTELVQQFDERIKLSNHSLYENFGLENGRRILEKYFQEIELDVYHDQLVVDDAVPLINYIVSCHGNQNEIIGKRTSEFKEFIEKKVNKESPFIITKESGIFICHKKIIK